MARNPLLRLAAAALGGMAVAAVLLAMIMVVNAGGFAGSTAATPMGWTIPLIAGALVSALAWLLLSDTRPRKASSAQMPSAVACRSCGSSCLDTWRLCPHCGTLLRNDASRS